MDHARDELFSHIQRCDVLGAAEGDQGAWMDDTIAYMAERYPGLSATELAQLDTMGRRYMEPVVPHGKEATAQNRSEWQEEVAVA